MVDLGLALRFRCSDSFHSRCPKSHKLAGEWDNMSMQHPPGMPETHTEAGKRSWRPRTLGSRHATPTNPTHLVHLPLLIPSYTASWATVFTPSTSESLPWPDSSSSSKSLLPESVLPWSQTYHINFYSSHHPPQIYTKSVILNLRLKVPFSTQVSSVSTSDQLPISCP